MLRVTKAKNIWQSTIGLVGAQKPYPLLLKTRFGIHTFGVSFPIDILILDQQHRVMRLKKSLQPNRVFFWSPLWSIVIELPQNSIDQQRIHIGDTVKLLEC